MKHWEKLPITSQKGRITMSEIIDRIADRLMAAQEKPGSVFLYPHIGIDGDALGSALALAIVLRRIGIAVRLPMDEDIPDRLNFLPGLDLIERYHEDFLERFSQDQQLAIAIDCSDSERVGRRRDLFDLSPEKAALDHHVSGGESSGLCLIDPSAAAAGEIVFDLIALLESRAGRRLHDETTETLLMTAIISDTGGFVYSNTSSRTFRTAASLMDGEINLRRITYQLFDMTSQVRMRLMGRIFTDVRFSHDGRLALALVGQNLLSEYQATDADLEGVIAHLRNVAGVEVAFLIREIDRNLLRVNIRSSDCFNAADFARNFGGGGHPKAAGLQLRNMSLDDAARMIVDKAGEWL
jgi:bifunctional oligoribonuclease and PAP phosphatase NrnA